MPVAEEMSCELGQHSKRPLDFEGKITHRLRESATAYDRVWTISVLVVISGPFIVVLTKLLPGIESKSAIRPEMHLVNSIEIIAFSVCFVQQHLFFRLYLNRLSNSKMRKVLSVLLATVLAGLAIVLSIFSFLGELFVAACVMSGYGLLLLVVLCDFGWLMIQARGVSV